MKNDKSTSKKKVPRKILLEEVKGYVIRYREAQMQQEMLEREKCECRSEIERIFDQLGIDSVDIECNDTTIRAQRYISQSVKYDAKKLLPILKEKGIHKKVIKLVIDNKELENAYNNGLISFDDIKDAADVKTSKVFRVQNIKS